jgi:orotate phosphoribosyltransferase
MLWPSKGSSLDKLIKDSTVYTELSNGELVPHRIDLKTTIRHKPAYIDVLSAALIKDISKLHVCTNFCCIYPSVAALIIISAATGSDAIKGTLLVKEVNNKETEYRMVEFRGGNKVKEVTLFDDISYSGDTLLSMFDVMAKNEISVKDAVTIIDRNRAASRRLKERGVILQSFVTVDF